MEARSEQRLVARRGRMSYEKVIKSAEKCKHHKSDAGADPSLGGGGNHKKI
jgi:hypothetical protein